MSVDAVREHLGRFGVADRIQLLGSSTATVQEAADAIGCGPAEIAKSIAFDVDGAAILVVASGDTRIDNARFKAQFGTKPKMMPPREMPTRVGHDVGGVSPFGVPSEVQIFLAESLRRFETVWPAAGSDNAVVWVMVEELEEFCNTHAWVSVTKTA